MSGIFTAMMNQWMGNRRKRMAGGEMMIMEGRTVDLEMVDLYGEFFCQHVGPENGFLVDGDAFWFEGWQVKV